jgi:hypothetical protein
MLCPGAIDIACSAAFSDHDDAAARTTLAERDRSLRHD